MTDHSPETGVPGPHGPSVDEAVTAEAADLLSVAH